MIEEAWEDRVPISFKFEKNESSPRGKLLCPYLILRGLARSEKWKEEKCDSLDGHHDAFTYQDVVAGDWNECDSL